MKGPIGVIKILLENKDKDLNISEISRLAGKDYKNTYLIVKQLAKEGIVKENIFGKSSKIILVERLHPLVYEAEYARRGELLKNKGISVMLDYFGRMRSVFFVLLIFGSYAKKTQTRHSDIDLMFIVPDALEEKMEREIQSVANLIPLDIHLNIFKESNFKAMHQSKEVTVGSEAIAHNVILHGIDAYYEMLK